MPSTALIVDDEPDLRDILALILEEADHVVHTAGSGAEAMAVMANDPKPDLVLLDLHLPDMDGLMLIERLRANPVCVEIPVVIISADAPALEALPALPNVYCFSKPFPMDSLLALVAKLSPVKP